MISVLLSLLAFAGSADEAGAESAPFACEGRHVQGAVLLCRTLPGAEVRLGDAVATADPDGFVVIGHDRDAPAEALIEVVADGAVVHMELAPVVQREYQIQRIEGVPPEYVTPPEETLARIRAEGAQKREAYASSWAGAGFLDGFSMPVEGRITGVYGSQRFYNGEPRRPHYGIDIAAPNGTEVLAPAAGVVTLADPDMYFEGGLIFIDHGQGLTSAFLHLSGVEVEVGQQVAKGEVIGQVGAGGRSTGAHLDWRIKWRDRYIDPALSLELQPERIR